MHMFDHAPKNILIKKSIHQTTSHLLFDDRFSVHIWGMIKHWQGLHELDISSWEAEPKMQNWWLRALLSTIPLEMQLPPSLRWCPENLEQEKHEALP